jgi:hypothetical protein
MLLESEFYLPPIISIFSLPGKQDMKVGEEFKKLSVQEGLQ